MLATINGFITVPRLDLDLLGDEQETTQTNRGAWHWLFDKAAWKAHTERFGRFTVDLQRGEIACSYRFLARAWNWSHGRVQRWLRLLADRCKISLRIANGIVVISLPGYSVRRESNPESQKPSKVAAERPVDDQQPSQSKKEESKKIDIDSKSVPVRRYAARSPQTQAQIRDRWIAKLGRFAAAKGFVAEFWTRLMGDEKEARSYLEAINLRMHAERWNDAVDQDAVVADRARQRRLSMSLMRQKWGHYQ